MYRIFSLARKARENSHPLRGVKRLGIGQMQCRPCCFVAAMKRCTFSPQAMERLGRRQAGTNVPSVRSILSKNMLLTGLTGLYFDCLAFPEETPNVQSAFRSFNISQLLCRPRYLFFFKRRCAQMSYIDWSVRDSGGSSFRYLRRTSTPFGPKLIKRPTSFSMPFR